MTISKVDRKDECFSRYPYLVFRGDSVIRKDCFFDLFPIKPEKRKKLTLLSLAFLRFLAFLKKSLKNLFFSNYGITSLAFRKNHHTREGLALVLKLKELILEYRVEIIGPIRQEVLSGISLHSSFLKLQNKFEAFEDLEITSSDYVRAAEMYNICRSKGTQGSHIDHLICAVSERYHLSIFTLDQDFQLYAKHLPILLYT